MSLARGSGTPRKGKGSVAPLRLHNGLGEALPCKVGNSLEGDSLTHYIGHVQRAGWETYLGWHYNHGCVLVGVNTGATGEDLPRRLRDSAFGKDAMAAYHKFLLGRPLV